eukprot:TRINITY_DN4600_c0_g2_i1.p1 TRINITY_DN4600_c0_g2~~TRINITY_DN4600_c0_g2_i1.p1  ORF type:complete len:117 (+),score=19.93 TRINITY_DN4600_c0_g2_i1:67-417(+)
MDTLTEDVLGYLIRFLDLQTTGQLALCSKIFRNGFVWSHVKHFDGSGLIKSYGYGVWEWLDKKARQFAKSLKNLEHLELDFMTGRHFLPLIKAKGTRLKTLVIHNSFMPESDRPLR